MLEEYDKKVSDQEKPVKDSWQPSLKEILAHSESSELFGKMLKGENENKLTFENN